MNCLDQKLKIKSAYPDNAEEKDDKLRGWLHEPRQARLRVAEIPVYLLRNIKNRDYMTIRPVRLAGIPTVQYQDPGWQSFLM